MKQAKSLIGVAIVLIAMYLVWKVMPAYYANFEFQDYVESQSRIESYSNHSEQEIAEIYAKKAADLEIPLTAAQIHVQRAGNDLTINAEYDVHIDVPVHPFDLHFSASTKNKKI
jgi:predicted small integral membrane protein